MKNLPVFARSQWRWFYSDSCRCVLPSAQSAEEMNRKCVNQMNKIEFGFIIKHIYLVHAVVQLDRCDRITCILNAALDEKHPLNECPALPPCGSAEPTTNSKWEKLHRTHFHFDGFFLDQVTAMRFWSSWVSGEQLWTQREPNRRSDCRFYWKWPYLIQVNLANPGTIRAKLQPQITITHERKQTFSTFSCVSHDLSVTDAAWPRGWGKCLCRGQQFLPALSVSLKNKLKHQQSVELVLILISNRMLCY